MMSGAGPIDIAESLVEGNELDAGTCQVEVRPAECVPDVAVARHLEALDDLAIIPKSAPVQVGEDGSNFPWNAAFVCMVRPHSCWWPGNAGSLLQGLPMPLANDPIPPRGRKAQAS